MFHYLRFCVPNPNFAFRFALGDENEDVTRRLLSQAGNMNHNIRMEMWRYSMADVFHWFKPDSYPVVSYVRLACISVGHGAKVGQRRKELPIILRVQQVPHMGRLGTSKLSLLRKIPV